MKKYKINEIFYSLQGEGINTGRPAVFIRFSGCNATPDFSCYKFCDTDHSCKMELTEDEILKEIKRYPADFVVLTGGEPTLQVDKDIVNKLFFNGYYLAIETNGSNIVNNDKRYECITVSPKNTDFKQRKGTELKLVYTGKENLDDYLKDTCFKPISKSIFNFIIFK